MSDTHEIVYEIALTAESPPSPVIYCTPRKAFLMIRSLKNGAEVLTLRLDGSKLQISSPCTWTLGSRQVWCGELQGPLNLESLSTYDGLKPTIENKLSSYESDRD